LDYRREPNLSAREPNLPAREPNLPAREPNLPAGRRFLVDCTGILNKLKRYWYYLKVSSEWCIKLCTSLSPFFLLLSKVHSLKGTVC
jgi:hypothetical protein